ncbi:MAG TPA: TonB-dependent receptor [Opitutaceae bacterium]|jgi:outer membrane receptor protein involved in Fe transport
MKTPCFLAVGIAACGVLCALAPSARAQATATSDGTDQQSTSNSNEVVTLPSFQVTGDQAHGYVASESTTGTRIASRIADLPFDVDVVTQPFLRDFAEFSLNDELSFVSGFSPSEVTGQYQLRGFSSSTELVDGFRRIGSLVDVVDVDRIEVIKGPDASIYGAIQPGGVVDIITPQPTAVPSGEFGIVAGGDNVFRSSMYSSGPLNSSGTLFYRVSAAYEFNDYAEDFASQKQTFESAKLLWKPDKNTSLTLDFEHTERFEHPFNQVLTITEKQTMPWAGNDVTESQYYGMATQNLLDYDYAGPESYNDFRLTSGTLTFEHDFSEIWNMKLGVNAYTNPYFDQLIGSGAYYPYGTGNVTVVNGAVTNPFTPEVKDQPQVDFKPQRGGGAQLDNLFKFHTPGVDNQLLLTADYYEVSQRILTRVPTVNGSQATDYYALYSPYNPSGAPYYTPQTTWDPALGYGFNTTLYANDPSIYNAVTTDQWTASGDYGLFASEHATMFNDKLILLAGGRWDYVRNQVKNYNIPEVGTPSALVTTEPDPYQAFDYNTSAWTYQLGATFKATSNINLYANKSDAFNPQPQIDSNTGLALPNNTSNGYDFGIKSMFMDNRLTLVLDRFVINEYNLAQTETDPVSGEKDTILSGLQTARGYEADLTYQVSNDFLIVGDWGYTDTTVEDSKVITFLNGLAVRRVPRDNVGLELRYQISHGFARGMFFVADGHYSSKSLVNLGSGKSIIPGPAGTTSGSTSSMYYVPSTNTTYATGKDPKIAGEVKITGTPFNNVPFPGSGNLPYPNEPANTLLNFPMSVTGTPLPLVSAGTPGVYSGEPEGVFVDDGRENNFNAPYAVFDVGTGYQWKMRKYTNTIQVNVKNVLDRKYTWGSGVPGLPFQVLVSYYINF